MMDMEKLIKNIENSLQDIFQVCDSPDEAKMIYKKMKDELEFNALARVEDFEEFKEAPYTRRWGYLCN